MTTSAPISPPLIAVDVGNSRTKLGRFAATPAGSGWVEPLATLEFASLPDAIPLDDVAHFLGGAAAEACNWHIASVRRAMSGALIDAIARRWPRHRVEILTARNLPLQVLLPEPEKVGVDRLCAAVAANCLRAADRPAVVVSVGTAMTVDLVDEQGQFRGGAILPGLRLAAQTLHAACDLLPELTFDPVHELPAPLGTSTQSAMQAGLFWGAVGSMRELIQHYAKICQTPPQVLLTGGFANLFTTALGSEARYVPQLVLAGIALAARSRPPHAP